MRTRSIIRVLAAVSLAVLAACSDDDPANPGAGAVPDFLLQDVNPESATYAEPVSPRDYLGMASAWYFGHAT